MGTRTLLIEGGLKSAEDKFMVLYQRRVKTAPENCPAMGCGGAATCRQRNVNHELKRSEVILGNRCIGPSDESNPRL